MKQKLYLVRINFDFGLLTSPAWLTRLLRTEFVFVDCFFLILVVYLPLRIINQINLAETFLSPRRLIESEVSKESLELRVSSSRL